MNQKQETALVSHGFITMEFKVSHLSRDDQILVLAAIIFMIYIDTAT